MHDDGGRQADEGAAEEAVEGHEHDYAGGAGHGDEAEAEDGGDGGAGDDDVEGADFVGEEVRDDSYINEVSRCVSGNGEMVCR